MLRLDPLTESDIRRVVDGHAGIADPGDFLWEAHERGVGGLLRNPQTLIMLADVVGRGRGLAHQPHGDLREGMP